MRLIVLLITSLLLITSCNKSYQTEKLPSNEESLSKVGVTNRFTDGIIVNIAPNDTSNILSLTKTTTTTKSKDIISDGYVFVFEFRHQPQSFNYSVVLPKQNANQTAVIENDGKWIDVNYRDEKNNIVVDLTTTFNSTKAGQKLVKLALINKDMIFTSYELIKNPYKTAPLSALAKLKLALRASVKFIIKGQNDNDLIKEYQAQKGTELEILVVGLYNNYDNMLSYDIIIAQDITYSIHDTVYCNAPLFNDLTIETRFDKYFRNASDEFYFATSTVINMGANSRPTDKPEQTYAVAYDQWGKVRWISYVGPKEFNRYPIRYKDQQAIVHFISEGDIIIENLIGKELFRSKVYPGHHMHHEALMIDDNKLALLIGFAIDDYGLVELDLNSGVYSNVIDFREIITKNRFMTADTWGAGLRDIIHTNSIAYSKSDNSYVISARHQGIFKVDRTTHQLKWIMTPPINLRDLHPEAQNKVLTAKGFDGNVFENWNIGQHVATVMPDGRIMCFDNHNRPLIDEVENERFSRVVVFSIDEQNMTVSKDWSYATPDKKYSPYMGSAYLLNNGNVLSAWPVHQYASEVKLGTNEIIWESSFQPENKRGDVYRTYKIKLY